MKAARITRQFEAKSEQRAGERVGSNVPLSINYRCACPIENELIIELTTLLAMLGTFPV